MHLLLLLLVLNSLHFAEHFLLLLSQGLLLWLIGLSVLPRERYSLEPFEILPVVELIHSLLFGDFPEEPDHWVIEKQVLLLVRDHPWHQVLPLWLFLLRFVFLGSLVRLAVLVLEVDPLPFPMFRLELGFFEQLFLHLWLFSTHFRSQVRLVRPNCQRFPASLHLFLQGNRQGLMQHPLVLGYQAYFALPPQSAEPLQPELLGGLRLFCSKYPLLPFPLLPQRTQFFAQLAFGLLSPNLLVA